MREILRQYLRSRKVELTEDELNFWSSLFIQKQFRKNEFLLREGETCKFTAFVIKGCLRLYAIDQKGKDHIMQFAPESWWISDMDSFWKSLPSVYFIDVMEDSDVALIDRASYEKALSEIPRLAIFFQELLQNRQAA